MKKLVLMALFIPCLFAQEMAQEISSPTNLELTMGKKSIKVTWEIPEVPENYAEISGYLLMKTWKEDLKTQQKVIQIQGKNKTSYKDTDVENEVNYSYKVCSFTANEVKGKKAISFLEQKIVLSPFTKEKTGQIIPKFKIRILGMAKDRNGENIAILGLKKWEKGKWLQVTCQVKEGEYIKAPNFDPKWKLLKIAPMVKRKKIFVVMRRVLVGQQLIVRKVNEARLITTSGIRYLDEEGKIITLFSR